VRPGGSIQAAIDRAQPGATIVVAGGVHAEQLTISTDGITLIGVAARLVPPPVAVTNICSGLAGDVGKHGPPTQVGICVAGTGVTLADFNGEHRKLISVGRRVRNVTVSGLRIENFSGADIAFVAATDARLDANRLLDGDHYGALTVGSTRTRFTRNVVATNSLHAIGVCADDATPTTVDHNDVSGYAIGFCVQTQRADVRHNNVHDNCIGVYVDPGIGAIVRENRISADNGPCEAFFDTGVGVYLQATSGTRVSGNRIQGHSTSGDDTGVVITDGEPGQVASNNTVTRNWFAGNGLDVLVNASGTGNTVTHNRCTTSQPAGLCN